MAKSISLLFRFVDGKNNETRKPLCIYQLIDNCKPGEKCECKDRLGSFHFVVFTALCADTKRKHRLEKKIILITIK